ncbi:1-deoxy-D-xylulose 5-phosphate reductoisomerase family protein [Mycobacterium avium subsp. avium 2285 (R)]|nr:1-deoxy-D-xylulose 5-phosphate reductoisomerase family protein [Mycobacterium avium subsp. avium 2285 (R)]
MGDQPDERRAAARPPARTGAGQHRLDRHPGAAGDRGQPGPLRGRRPGRRGANLDTLLRQRAETGVTNVAVADEHAARRAGDIPFCGPEAATRLVEETEADVVLNALVGALGLRPTLAALESGARLALANKESLIAGGPLVLAAAAPGQIVPVDSEHSALAQCLRGGTGDEVAKLVLTASGGPFRGWTAEELEHVTPEQAGAHPTWSMGPMNTLNSASLVNKGLELIETHLLFGIPYDRIEVVVHPQSIVHSMVTFVDGSTLAQASPPDMRLPISLALGWPHRVPGRPPAATSPPRRAGNSSRWTTRSSPPSSWPATPGRPAAA